jgi:peptide-methionine (R)-S-oxide reductase
MRLRTIVISSIIVAAVAAMLVMDPPEVVISSAAAPSAQATPKPSKTKSVREITYIDGEFDGVAVMNSDDEWKKLLTATEYYILRKEGTEKPYTGSLLNNKKKGSYHCAACGLAVFSSDHKYNSETGWPSFYQPVFKKNVAEKPDRSLEEERVEVECARCGGHLGHVFDDGPEPTGLRYCINSVALRFKPAK